MSPLDTPTLADTYQPITDLARQYGIPFHLAANSRHASLHLHLPDGALLAVTDDGVGGAAARKPSGATGWQITRTLPTGQRAVIYDSTLLGDHHRLGVNPSPVLGAIARYLPPPPSPKPTRTRRRGLLTRLLRLT
ncbi:hypothetical protein AB0E96_00435 [Kitasatospora sp. NPDC036755]|uniref:hypothetical protein n=1 Tax=Kitasatospora sp. NPDC036755 TaxID=3154600 RepID=UPI00340F6599